MLLPVMPKKRPSGEPPLISGKPPVMAFVPRTSPVPIWPVWQAKHVRPIFPVQLPWTSFSCASATGNCRPPPLVLFGSWPGRGAGLGYGEGVPAVALGDGGDGRIGLRCAQWQRPIELQEEVDERGDSEDAAGERHGCDVRATAGDRRAPFPAVCRPRLGGVVRFRAPLLGEELVLLGLGREQGLVHAHLERVVEVDRRVRVLEIRAGDELTRVLGQRRAIGLSFAVHRGVVPAAGRFEIAEERVRVRRDRNGVLNVRQERSAAGRIVPAREQDLHVVIGGAAHGEQRAASVRHGGSVRRLEEQEVRVHASAQRNPRRVNAVVVVAWIGRKLIKVAGVGVGEAAGDVACAAHLDVWIELRREEGHHVGDGRHGVGACVPDRSRKDHRGGTPHTVAPGNESRRGARNGVAV